MCNRCLFHQKCTDGLKGYFFIKVKQPSSHDTLCSERLKRCLSSIFCIMFFFGGQRNISSLKFKFRFRCFCLQIKVSRLESLTDKDTHNLNQSLPLCILVSIRMCTALSQTMLCCWSKVISCYADSCKCATVVRMGFTLAIWTLGP